MGWKGLLTLAIVILAVGGIALGLRFFPTAPKDDGSASTSTPATSAPTYPLPPTGSSSPPVYVAGAQQRVECTGVNGAIARLDESELLAPPPSGAKWTYDWYEGEHFLAHGERAN